MAAKFLSKNSRTVELFLRRPQCQHRPMSYGSNHGALTTGQSSVEKLSQDCCRVAGAKNSFSSIAAGIVPSTQLPELSEYMQLWSTSMPNWTLVNERTFETQPETVILLGDNAMITSRGNNIAEVFYYQDNFKCTLPSPPTSLRSAARYPDGRIILCGKRELAFYNANCDFTTSTKLSTGCPHTMTVDMSGNIILGMLDTKTIAIHNPDGSFNRLFHTDSSPLSLAITSKNHLVVSFVDGTVQILDYLHHQHPETIGTSYIRPPSLSLRQWQPTGICCSGKGEIFVVDWGQGAVYRYTADGEYLSCVCEGLRDPQDIAVSANGEELQIFETGLSASIVRPSTGPRVKTFSLDK